MDGVLNIDKPAGITSHDVVARVRHLLQERRVGHTGTLDPFATGVLVVLVGRATRLAQFLSGVEKEYEAVIRLGYATDTGDVTGKRIGAASQTDRSETHPPAIAGGTEKSNGPDSGGHAGSGNWSKDQITAALESLRGELDQVPPMYSAKKQGGRKLYELARRGEEVERAAVRVCIYKFEAINAAATQAFELLKANGDGTFDFAVRVACSTGTYIRTLAEDFGKLLGVGAHLAELRRTRVGDFTIAEARTLDQLKLHLAEESLGTVLLSADRALGRLPVLDLTTDEVGRVCNGLSVKVSRTDWNAGERVRLRDDQGNLIAVAEFNQAQGALHPSVVIARDGS
jgi:tRNA pseudouridine55 synthase